MKPDPSVLAGAALGLILAAVHLSWEALNGGIVSHHLLADPTMPAISNWFGIGSLAIIGALAGWSLSRSGTDKRPWLIGLVAAFGYGAAIAFAFETGEDAVAQSLFAALFAIAVLLPIYRFECLFGFLLGLTYSFGGIIPLGIGLVLMLVSRLLHPVARYIARRLRASLSASEDSR